MPTAVRRLLRLPTPTPEDLENWPVREDRPAKPKPVTRVSGEAARLDRILPGWEHNVSKWKLLMSTNELCVLGQLYGSYVYGMDAVMGDAFKDGGGWHNVDWTAYNTHTGTRQAWKKEINYRRSL
jgi:hypothetical protein